jgi:hypothetical protein
VFGMMLARRTGYRDQLAAACHYRTTAKSDCKCGWDGDLSMSKRSEPGHWHIAGAETA